MRYNEEKLGDYIDVLSGFAFKTKDFVDIGIPIIKIKNISPPAVTLEDLTYVSNEIAEKQDKFLLSYNDVLIAMTGSHINQWASVVGRVARVKYNAKTLLNQRVGKITIKSNAEANIDYIYYFLSQDDVKIELAAKAGGAANQANISPANIKDLKFPCPPLETQHRIASILSAYDDLIENNQKQIKLLEEAAQRLYKEWFVDLRFPGYENTPIVDGVPEGWRECLLSDVADVNKLNLPKNNEYDSIDYIDLSSVKKGHILEKTRYKINEAPGRAKRLAIDGDIIWGMVRPNLCAYALVMHPNERDVFSTGFAVISSKKVPFSYLYCLATEESFIGYLVKCTNGAAYPAVKPIHFEEAKILKPVDEILNQFHSIAEPIYRRIEALDKMVISLAEARDRLLPKLMSGELEV